MTNPSIAIFDLGAVLIDWNPRYLFRKLMTDEAQIDAFLRDVCDHEWNLSMDKGKPFAQAVAEKSAQFPEMRDTIEAYHQRWIEMIAGPIHGSVQLLEELDEAGVPLFALTNWSAETFPLVRHQPDYAFLNRFRHIVVSGEIRMVKPNPDIFNHTLAIVGETCLVMPFH